MVVALACPDLHCVLLDKNSKKTRFCLQVVAELDLSNVEVVHARAEDYQPDRLFSTVVARALGKLSELLSLTHHLLQPGGCLITMKGANLQRELGSLPATWRRPQVIPLEVPGLAMERHLIVFDARTASTEDPA
jgi:16S rRNA (guanine527-N7)-methyltransferase